MIFSKHRFEFFNDGVMAIIMTIMVLEIPLSNTFNVDKIIDLLRSIITFFVSFFIVGSFWNQHHRLIDGVKKINSKIIWQNHLFLFFLALLPIFTKWVIENPNEFIPAIAYDIVFFMVYLSYFFLAKVAIGKEKLEEIRKLRLSMMESKYNKKMKILKMIIHLITIMLFIVFIILLFLIQKLITIITMLLIIYPVVFSLLKIFIEEHDYEYTHIMKRQAEHLDN